MGTAIWLAQEKALSPLKKYGWRQLASLGLLAERAAGPCQGTVRTGREGDAVVREAAVRAAHGHAEEAVVALTGHVEAPSAAGS